ncbi:hypothetical protein ASPCAL12505 [Aspergillus calidoustus]|uniref:Rhodopsin domain-containing protein n=1 Tax=Aspergillus calidoustus TaxID=454130 RepID=A0A0U5GFA5_ASPCI|nr:hypothetical protein ASPCAL12505 [Aspergillus calidoustus]
MNDYAESWTLLALALALILLRIYVRWTQTGPGNFQLDDYLMPLAGAVFAVEVSLAYLVGAKYQGLTNSYMTSEQRAAIDPSSREYYNRVWGSKIQVAGWSLYAMVLWLVKFSLAVFYSRLTTGLNHLPSRVRIAYLLLGVSYLAVALTIILSCQPMHRFWQISPDPGNICQPACSKVYVLVVMIPNVLTDIYLMSIPLPLLWTVRIGIRRKVTLMALFSGAVFVIMAAIIRAVTILTAGADGAVSGSKWACRESFVSIIVSNLPIVQPLIRRGASKIGLSGLFSNSGGPSDYQGPSGRRRGESHQLSSGTGLKTANGGGTVSGMVSSKSGMGLRLRGRCMLRVRRCVLGRIVPLVVGVAARRGMGPCMLRMSRCLGRMGGIFRAMRWGRGGFKRASGCFSFVLYSGEANV